MLLPAANIVLGMLIFARPDGKNGEAVNIEGNNAQALSAASIRDNKLYLTRNSGVQNANVDVIFFGRGKKKRSYSIQFGGNVACIDPGFAFEDVKIIVLKVDGHVVNKKKIGYPNNILNIATSVGLLLGIVIPGLLHAIYHSYEVYDFQVGYAVFYLVPVVLGLIIGVSHYFLVRLVTRSFNK